MGITLHFLVLRTFTSVKDIAGTNRNIAFQAYLETYDDPNEMIPTLSFQPAFCKGVLTSKRLAKMKLYFIRKKKRLCPNLLKILISL